MCEHHVVEHKDNKGWLYLEYPRKTSEKMKFEIGLE